MTLDFQTVPGKVRLIVLKILSVPNCEWDSFFGHFLRKGSGSFHVLSGFDSISFPDQQLVLTKTREFFKQV